MLDEFMAGPDSGRDRSRRCDSSASLRNQGLTLILVEHIVWALLDLSQRIIVLSAGEKIAEGPPASYRERSSRDRSLSGRKRDGLEKSSNGSKVVQIVQVVQPVEMLESNVAERLQHLERLERFGTLGTEKSLKEDHA